MAGPRVRDTYYYYNIYSGALDPGVWRSCEEQRGWHHIDRLSIMSTVWKCLGSGPMSVTNTKRETSIQAGEGEGEGAVSAVRAGAWGSGGTDGKPGQGQAQSGASNTEPSD